jgi:hypothetical protein
MRFLIVVVAVSFKMLMAQQSDFSPTLLPDGPCDVYPLGPKCLNASAFSSVQLLVDNPSVPVSTNFTVGYNPSEYRRLTYSFTFDRKPSYLLTDMQTGFSVMCDFVRSRDYSLAIGLSANIEQVAMKWDNMIFSDQLTVSDTLPATNEISFMDGTTRRAATFHGHFFYSSPHYFLSARFYNLTTPNTGFVSYSQNPIVLQIKAGYHYDTQRGFRTIAGGWKRNYAGNNIYEAETIFQLRKFAIGAQMNSSYMAGALVLSQFGKMELGAGFYVAKWPSQNRIVPAQALVFVNYKLIE